MTYTKFLTQPDLSSEELYKRIKQVLVVEVMSKLLKDLSPEEKKAFNEAVKSRPFFK